MPTYEVTDPETGRTVRLTGDSPPTLQELEEIFGGLANQESSAQPIAETTELPTGEEFGGETVAPTNRPDTFGENVLDVAAEVAAGANRAAMFIPDTIVEGVNLATGADFPTLTEGVAALTGQTPGQGGFMEPGTAREAAGAFGEVVIPGVAGLTQVAGRNLARLPGAAAEFLGFGSAVPTVPARVGAEIVSPTAAPPEATQRTVREVAESVTDPAAGMTSQQRLLQQIERGDVEGARFRVRDGVPVRDDAAIDAINQGFDEGAVAMIKNASDVDKEAMREMASIRRRALENLRFGAENRATNVIGDRVMDRVKHVQRVRDESGKAVREAAKNLETEPFNWDGARQGFASMLDELGVAVTRNEQGRPILDFAGSAVEGLGQQNSIKKLFTRIQNNKDWSARGAHEMKKFMDELIAWGRSPQGGLAGRTENLLKGLRRGISDQLNEAFPEYGNANRVFSRAIETLDDFQKAIGPSIDLASPQANKSTGTALRGLLSNNKSRVALSDSLINLDEVANDPTMRINMADRIEDLSATQGRRFQDDLLTLTAFADELDAVFGPSARTSLAGESAKAVRDAARTAQGGGAGVLVEKAAEAIEQARGINRENAQKALNELLSR